jgi:uncharacterized protein YwgA
MPRARASPSKSFDPEARLQDVIKSFVARYNYLHEWRIQKLVFYADLLSLSRRGYRLTSADFKKHFYGVFSSNIREELWKMSDLTQRPDKTPTGKDTKRFQLQGSLVLSTLSKEDISLIEEAHEATRDLTNEQLADWGKETTLWRTTDQGALLDLRGYGTLMSRDSRGDVERYRELRAKTETRKARFKNVKELRRALEKTATES